MYKRTCIVSREIKHRRCRLVCIGDETEQLGRNEFLILRNHIVHTYVSVCLYFHVIPGFKTFFAPTRPSKPCKSHTSKKQVPSLATLPVGAYTHSLPRQKKRNTAHRNKMVPPAISTMLMVDEESPIFKRGCKMHPHLSHKG